MPSGRTLQVGVSEGSALFIIYLENSVNMERIKLQVLLHYLK